MLKIITTRRIVQTFFFVLFIWFSVVATLGERGWQLRGWPVNWFLQLDPLVGVGVLLATHTLYAGLLWAVATLVMTLFLGRVFCGWLCPMGALQHFIGYLGMRSRTLSHRIKSNQPHPARHLKYWFLLFLLSAAAADMAGYLIFIAGKHAVWSVIAGVLLVLAFIVHHTRQKKIPSRKMMVAVLVVFSAVLWHHLVAPAHWLATTLQTGLLDPIPFLHRAVNLVLLPLVDRPLHVTAVGPRFYEGSLLIGVVFLAVILLGVRIPRFYCRYICPLGALLGLFSRWALWRMGKSENLERQCRRCESHCQGACAPSQIIHTSECLVCLNCMDQCRHNLMGFHRYPSAAGEAPGPELGRRQVVSAIVAGLLVPPIIRVNGSMADNWNPAVIRPPGTLKEADFLARCIKCGQCMRICPTNVIQPARLQSGMEGLWTPLLNFRVSTSGCQHNCVACSHICPTAALRPISVDERMGRGDYADAGPLRIGMAFVDRGRCLPWAMDTPCIVCQENCPVSPKAIFIRSEYRIIRNGEIRITSMTENRITYDGFKWPANALGSGDYFIIREGREPLAINSNSGQTLLLPSQEGMAIGESAQVAVKLQKPFIDPGQCIGCGVCEHECPVQGRRAIRVTAENESRNERHRMTLG